MKRVTIIKIGGFIMQRYQNGLWSQLACSKEATARSKVFTLRFHATNPSPPCSMLSTHALFKVCLPLMLKLRRTPSRCRKSDEGSTKRNGDRYSLSLSKWKSKNPPSRTIPDAENDLILVGNRFNALERLCWLFI